MGETAHISVFQLFNKLQQEYIICLIRSKIYPIKKDKNYWIKTAKNKREKIEDISLRNKIKSIFNDKDLYREVESQVMPEWGEPKFYYPSKENREKQIYWDLFNYFSIGCDVKVRIKSSLKYGTIIDKDIDSRIVQVIVNKQKHKISMSDIGRIL